MKKVIRYIFIFLLVLIIGTGIIFRKPIRLLYGLGCEYYSAKDNSMTISLNADSDFEVKEYRDIVYKETDGVPLKLDIYGPSQKHYDKSPVILYVHGGSWAYGDKSLPDSFSSLLNTFRNQGYTIISTSYELMLDGEKFNKQVCDIKDTLRWINKNSDEYNLDTDEIGILSFSSGAHISMIAAYSDDNEFTDDSTLSSYPSDVKYLINCSGPTDLNLLNTSDLNYDLTKIFDSINKKSDKNEFLKKFNPITYVNKEIPDTLIIHSRSDSMVPYESAVKLYDKGTESEADMELITLENTSHDSSDIAGEDFEILTKGILKFIILHSPV